MLWGANDRAFSWLWRSKKGESRGVVRGLGGARLLGQQTKACMAAAFVSLHISHGLGFL